MVGVSTRAGRLRLAAVVTATMLVATACGGSEEPAAPAPAPAPGAPDAPPAEVTPRKPDGPVEMTLGTGVGGMPDVVMRAALNCLRQDGISDVNVVVQNRTGGSWSVSYDFLMDQRGSGNYLGAITQPLVTTPPTRGIDYWHEELRPIALLLGLDVGPMVRGDSPWETFEDMAQYARENPGALRWGGAQVGATAHIVMGLLENAIGAEITYVPYESGGAADAALLSGDVDVVNGRALSADALLEAGEVSFLALFGDRRLVAPGRPWLEAIPTSVELGYPDAQFRQWVGVLGPPDMPEDVALYWEQAFGELATNSPCWDAYVLESVGQNQYIPMPELVDFLAEQAVIHRDILVSIGVVDN
jgi:putative tricarboxylic transport membrane protein